MEKARNWKQKLKKNRARKVEKSTPKPGKSRPGGGLGGLGGDLWKKNDLEAVLADFGQARGRWANLAAKWGQDGAKAQDRVWLAILRPVGELSWIFLGVLGLIFAKMVEV